MRVFLISKQSLLRLGKYIGIYLIGLSAGAFVGLLPLLALVAGLPIIFAERQMGRRPAQIVALVCLGATWLLMDDISFVYVGLGLMVGYGLAMIPEHVPFRFGLLQSITGGFVWVLVMNAILKLVHGEGLLSMLVTQFQQAIAMTVESMQSLELYTAAQLADFQQYGEMMLETLRLQWGYLLFVYLLISTALTYALSRAFGSNRQPIEDFMAARAPLPLGVAAVLLGGVHYLLPSVATGLVTNLWSIISLLMSLYGFFLLFFYLRFLRVGLIWRMILAFYLFTSPVVWRVMLLVGIFDTFFDYRFYAFKRQQG